MKKYVLSIILMILLVNIVVGDVSATTVFLTSDNIVDPDSDKKLLNSIADYVEQLSNGDIKVIIDGKAPEPGEGTRAILSDKNVSVVIGACCAGSLLIMAKYSAATPDKQIIYVNSGDFDLDTATSLRRAWDDNYSNGSFAGYNKPGKLLNDSGISYIQPVKNFSEEFPDGILNKNNDEVNKYIAQEIIKSINGYDNSSKKLDTDLIITHKIPVNKMAKGSAKLYAAGGIEDENITFGGYTGPQLLYLTSSYLNGNGLEEPGNFKEPDSPMKSSMFVKDSYSIYDYMKMAGIVRKYMDEHHQAPDSIEYDGAQIGYYDLQYNFAKLTKNHTDYRHMTFDQEYEFDKTNDSILVYLLPFLIGGVIILSGYLIIRRRRARRRRKRMQRQRQRQIHQQRFKR